MHFFINFTFHKIHDKEMQGIDNSMLKSHMHVKINKSQ